MWRTMYKLTKTFGDQPGPRRIADSVKGKIDKFKQHLPILHTICNPGIRDRHWEAVSPMIISTSCVACAVKDCVFYHIMLTPSRKLTYTVTLI